MDLSGGRYHHLPYTIKLDSTVVNPFLCLILIVSFVFHHQQNIFQGKDIREQLPSECKEFEDISGSWKTIMTHLQKTSNVLQGTHHPGMTAYI